MRIMTDVPDRSEEWLGSLIAPESVKRSFSIERDTTSLAWWRRLGSGPGEGWQVAVLPELALWRHMVLIGDAPGSQYDTLLETARTESVLPGPIAALALTGRGFHGNRGRPWRACAGNLHLSAALPVDLPAARCGAVVSAVAAVAVVDALRAVCGPQLDARIKWVNDILVEDAKVAGVLAATQTRADRLTAIVIGIGVNLRVTPEVTPTLFVPRVTCLADHPAGAAVVARPGMLVAALLAALARGLADLTEAGPEPAVAAYRRHCQDLGRRVRIWAEGLPDVATATSLPPPLAAGRIAAIADDLSLRIEGYDSPIVGGRLAYEESCRRP